MSNVTHVFPILQLQLPVRTHHMHDVHEIMKARVSIAPARLALGRAWPFGRLFVRALRRRRRRCPIFPCFRIWSEEEEQEEADGGGRRYGSNRVGMVNCT